MSNNHVSRLTIENRSFHILCNTFELVQSVFVASYDADGAACIVLKIPLRFTCSPFPFCP